MDFVELKVWKAARELRNRIFNLVKKLPTSEEFSLKKQIIRSSRSVTANIAEGHGRFHFKENIRYCYIARGSLEETLDHLICALDCEYISNKEYEDLLCQYSNIVRMLNAYISFLKKKHHQNLKNGRM